MTHDELCDRAGKWLRTRRGCQVTMIEKGTQHEVADAFGVKWPHTTWMIECKTSRADFTADLHKPFRGLTEGMGQFRYYMTPPGLLDPVEIPKGWGLLEVHRTMVKEIVLGDRRTEYDHGKEWRMLMKLLLDLKWRGCLSPDAIPWQGSHPTQRGGRVVG